MSVTQANVDFMWGTVIMPRVGTPYGWGGSFDPNNVRVGTDCSGAVSAVVEALLHGPQMKWQRQFWTGTFQGLRPPQVGPYGLVCIPNPDAHPADAVAIVAIRQGPSAESSHMMIQVGGTNIEDGSGLVTGADAADIHDRQFNQWFFLPGPIVGAAPHPTYSPREQHILAIIAEGRRRNISERGIVIALSVALVESNIKIYANTKDPASMALPHEAVGQDSLSAGIFQQQPWWGPLPVRMSDTGSAGLFFGSVDPKGLQQFDFDNTIHTPGYYAAEVQQPLAKYRGRYDERMAEAQELYDQYSTATTQPEGGFLMALTDDEQHELLDLVRQESKYRRISRSALRHLDEKETETISGFEWNTDGSVHVLYCFMRAQLGDPVELALIQEVAGADLVRYPERTRDKALAQAMLNKLAATGAAPVYDAGTAPPVVVAPPHVGASGMATLGREVTELKASLDAFMAWIQS